MVEWFLVIGLQLDAGSGATTVPMQSIEACRAAAINTVRGSRYIRYATCVNSVTGEVENF